jgi:hypothetical protein
MRRGVGEARERMIASARSFCVRPYWNLDQGGLLIT